MLSNFIYRIPRQVVIDKKGFLEDRRPASNFDPYLVTDALVRVVVLRHESLRNPYAEPKVIKLSVDLSRVQLEEDDDNGELI